MQIWSDNRDKLLNMYLLRFPKQIQAQVKERELMLIFLYVLGGQLGSNRFYSKNIECESGAPFARGASNNNF